VRFIGIYKRTLTFFPKRNGEEVKSKERVFVEEGTREEMASLYKKIVEKGDSELYALGDNPWGKKAYTYCWVVAYDKETQKVLSEKELRELSGIYEEAN